VQSSQEQFVDVPGGRVWTTTFGEGDSTLLVLHGGPGMPSHYLESLAGLADGVRVVFYDQLGCGRSERPDDPSLWTVERAVAEVHAVTRELGLQNLTLLGHSWGGYLALSCAAAGAVDLAGLVMSSPLVSVERWMQDAATLLAQLPDDVAATIARHEADGSFEDPEYAEATMHFYRRFFCKLDPWPTTLERTFDEMGQQPYQLMWGPSEFTQTGNLRGQDLSDHLNHLSVPSLWICGSQDEVLPSTLAHFAHAARGQLHVFEGGTHCVHLEQTDRYLEVVRSFLTHGAEKRMHTEGTGPGHLVRTDKSP